MKVNWTSSGSKLALAAGLVPSPSGLGGSYTTCDLIGLFQNLVNFGFEIAVPLAIIGIVYGGFRIMTAGASPDGEEAGKEAMKTALIGIVIVFGAWILISTLLYIFGAHSSLLASCGRVTSCQPIQ